MPGNKYPKKDFCNLANLLRGLSKAKEWSLSLLDWATRNIVDLGKHDFHVIFKAQAKLQWALEWIRCEDIEKENIDHFAF